MPHQRLLKHLEDQMRELGNPQYVQDLGEALRLELAERVPVQTATLATNLLKISTPARTPEGFSIGVGDKDKLGNPNRAPRGTIAAFLRDFPRFRIFNRFGMAGGITNSAYAWWALSSEAKRRLQQERLSGMYGGGYQGVGVGKSAYFYPQEGTLPEWAESAAGAGIHPTHFVSESLIAWAENAVSKILSKFVIAMRRA